MKSDVFGWFDNLEKGDVSDHFECLRGCSTPPQECCILPPTYLWTTWQQTRAFLKSVNHKSDGVGWFDNFEKEDVSGHFERFRG